MASALVISKVLLAIFNFILLACGFSLITGGMLLLVDKDRLILSRLLTIGPWMTLPHPFLYYIAIALATVGLVLTTTGVLGCWASCIHSYAMLTIYFLIIFVALVLEFAVYIVALAWPNCLGLIVDSLDLTKNLQKSYGTTGHEQFTAAVDLAQTMFRCCGVESANEYDTSMWRLQSNGPSLTVPLTCCHLESSEGRAFLDPKPINTTLCQALELTTHHGYRYLDGCIDHLEQWFHHHYIIFLAIGLTAVLVEFLVVLSTIFTCTRIYQHNHQTKETISNKTETIRCLTPSRSTAGHLFQRSLTGAYSNEMYNVPPSTSTYSYRQKFVDRL